MKCPACGMTDSPFTQGLHENEDGSITCTGCGFTFAAGAINDTVDKLVEDVNNLRSIVVCLMDGRAVTFSFPKDIEPGHKDETERARWRSYMETVVTSLVMHAFPKAHIAEVTFDDEID